MSTQPKLSYLPDFEGSKALYSRLRGLEIRVLTIWPNEDHSAPLECSLRVVSLRKAPRYTALSYYWGLVNDQESVYIHGSDEAAPIHSCRVPVTQKLASALRTLRVKATAKSVPLVMWTDALCINQRDPEERSVQIRIMKYVYAQSHRVQVWLDERNQLAEMGLAALEVLSDIRGTHALHAMGEVEVWSHNDLEQAWENGDLMKGVMTLLSLPYWRRGWVIQEAASHERVFLSLGKVTYRLTNWLSLLQTFDALATETLSRQKSMFDDLVAHYGTLLSFELAARSLQNPHLSVSPVLEAQLIAILNNKGWQTTDPRDAVFALAGFLSMFEDIEPNYHDSVEEVFSKATMAVLHRKHGWKNRGVLDCWIYPHASPFLPSWAIDFATGASNHESEGGVDIFYNHTIRFDASYGSKLEVRRSTPRTLSIAGFVFDEIHTISRCLTSMERAVGDMQALSAEWYRMVEVGLQGPERFSTLLRTLSMDTGPGDRPFIDSDGELDRPADQLTSSESAAQKRLVSVIADVLVNKRLFITRQGRLGLSHNSADVGDRIAIFASGDMPFIIRSVSAKTSTRETHILIGACFCDGTFRLKI